MGKPKLLRVNTNLYIRTAGNAKSWIFRYSLHGRSHDIGLGSLSHVTVAKAEALAHEMREKLRQGIEPRPERGRHTKTPSLKEVAAEYLKRTLPGLKPKSRQRWIGSLEAYAFPKIGNLPVSRVCPADVARCLAPIWISHRETSRKLRSYIERIMNAAKANGQFIGENPAKLDVLESLLPQRPRRVVAHHSAMSWRELPAFMVDLACKDTLSARALEWTILTAVRTSDTLEAQWSEIDGALWTIPPERTKTGKPHRVPLSRQAIAILPNPKDGLLFPGIEGRPMSNMTMQKVLKTMRPGLTVHGFRSTARDWAAERGVSHEVAEAMLGHAIAKTATVAAYLRTDHLQARCALMQQWSDFLLPRKKSVRRLTRSKSKFLQF
jgi:integrase